MKQEMNTSTKGKILNGKVTALGRVKTIAVEVVHLKRHPLYKKSVKRTKTYAVHVEETNVEVGDKVRILEVRPISKTKHFILLEKIGA